MNTLPSSQLSQHTTRLKHFGKSKIQSRPNQNMPAISIRGECQDEALFHSQDEALFDPQYVHAGRELQQPCTVEQQ
jgi:hypothetical protein